jgi:gliding motility-associated-like protein
MVPMALCGQAPPPSCTENVFNKTLGNPAYNMVEACMVDAGNSSFIIGTYKENIPNTGYTQDALIFKLTNGVKQWELSVDGTATQLVADMIKLKDGNFVALIGQLYGNSGYTLLKFDANGNIIWQKDYTTADAMNGIANISEDTDGALFIAYKIDQNYLSFQDRIYFAKLDANGNFIFSKIYVNGKYSWLSTIETRDMYVKDGFSYICASWFTYYQEEGLLMKINNANGNIEWSKTYDVAGGPLEFYHIFPYKNNTLCITAYDGSYNYFRSDTAEVLITDMQGNLQSMKYYTAGPTKLSPGRITAMDSNGMLIQSECIYDDSYNILQRVLTKIDPLNDVIWSKHYPSFDNVTTIREIIPTDTSLYLLASNLENSTHINLNFIKMTTKGEFGCPSEPLSFHLQDITSTPENAGFIGLDYSTTATTRAPAFASNFALDEGMSCAATNMCNTIKLSGDQMICHNGDTATLQFSKNAECSSSPSFVFDNQYFGLIDVKGSNARFKALKPGTSKIKAIISTTCNNVSDELELKIVDNPSILNLGNDTSICDGNTIIIDADKRFKKFLWQDNSTSSSIKISAPGKYYLSAFDSCDNIYIDTILVSAKAVDPLNLPPSVSICENDSVTITAPDGFMKYSWSNNYAISNSTGRSIKIAPSIDTAYYLAAEKTPGCSSFDTVNVKVMHKMPVGLRSDTTLCAGDSVLLKANGGFVTYGWNTGEKTQQIYVKKQGTYLITAVDNNACISKDTFALQNVFDAPVVNLNKEPWICEGVPRTLQANKGYTQYLWNTGNATASIEVNAVGKYWVTVTDKNLCTNADTVLIKEIKPVPHDFLPRDTTFCKYRKLILAIASDFVSYNWNTGEQTKNIAPTQAGTYIAKVTDLYGCEGKDTIILTPIDCLVGIFFPNAFSPNGDGKNDVFKPLVYTTLLKYEFSIYNRFGNKVFETNNIEQGWDGTINGMPQNSGNFVWICKYQLEGEPLKVEKGFALLLR